MTLRVLGRLLPRVLNAYFSLPFRQQPLKCFLFLYCYVTVKYPQRYKRTHSAVYLLLDVLAVGWLLMILESGLVYS